MWQETLQVWAVQTGLLPAATSTSAVADVLCSMFIHFGRKHKTGINTHVRSMDRGLSVLPLNTTILQAVGPQLTSAGPELDRPQPTSAGP